jgi:cell division protein FtsN
MKNATMRMIAVAAAVLFAFAGMAYAGDAKAQTKEKAPANKNMPTASPAKDKTKNEVKATAKSPSANTPSEASRQRHDTARQAIDNMK